jgi:hypothetical protein
MQRSKILLMLSISLIIIAWGKNDAFSQVYVTVPDVQTEQDSTILVPVLVSDLSSYGIISYQFEVFFDSLVIKAKGVSAVNTLTAPWGNAVANTDSAGKMIVGAFGVSVLTAGDTLLNLVFEVVAKPGDSTSIILKDFRFNNGNPTAIVDNGSLEIMLQSGIANRKPAAMIPQKMQLLYNYPEPFQDRTSIVVNLIQSAPVEIEIFNILGQNIKHFGINLITAGQLQIDWNATHNQGVRVPPGVYFCVVRQSNKTIAVDRMILVN